MSLFKPAESTQAYLKMGVMGFAGSGKTYTAAHTAIGLVNLLKQLGLAQGDRPAFFLDTETGSDYVKRHFDEAGLALHTAKTRAFADLIPAVRDAEKDGSVLIIDSITHFWREFTETYARKKNRTRLEFSDWNFLKTEWGRFTDAYINSAIHIILCGRAGYEYDFFEDQDGKKQLEKTGVKMKAEAEMGYEPSLLVFMERIMDMETKKVYRQAHVLKERFDCIDGHSFRNPTFENFMPHIAELNLGGKQLGIDTSRTSEGLIPVSGKPDWQYEKEQRDIALDEIAELVRKHHGGQSEDAKRIRGDLMEKHFGTRSWKRMETLDYHTVKDGRAKLWVELEGVSYEFVPPADRSTQLDEDITMNLPKAA